MTPMFPENRQRQSMLALVLFLLAVFVAVSYRFYRETEIKVAAQSGVQQGLIAKTAAAGVEGYFDTINKRLEKELPKLVSIAGNLPERGTVYALAEPSSLYVLALSKASSAVTLASAALTCVDL